MSFSATELRVPVAQHAATTEDALIVDLADGRTVTVPRGCGVRELEVDRRRERDTLARP